MQTGQGANKELQEDFAKHIYEDSSLYVENYVEVNEKYAKRLHQTKRQFAKHIYEDSSLYVENYVEVNEKYAKRLHQTKRQ
ncbi:MULTISPECIES: hypothetical protein [Clostridia]|uniref:hypothetical protein n=1 Tax=Clostridia TaxID=186801 RepID=UPI00336BE0E0